MQTRPIEELSLNAWPALQTVQYDGWVLRLANGYTRRANSVNPLYPSSLETTEKIRFCEEFYSTRGLDTVFKLTPSAEPTDLDAMLASACYQRQAPTSVQTLRLADVNPPPSADISLENDISEDWVTRFFDLSTVNTRYRQTAAKILDGILPVHSFATLWQDSTPVAMGLAVIERGYVGLFDVVTAEPARNRGLGTRLVLHLLHWGKSQGATHAYLQVMHDNAPALHLYARLGFRESYTYWYRVK